MNYKLVESYIKDQLRKIYGKQVFCENGIAYIGSAVEINFAKDNIIVTGYKTGTDLFLHYPDKGGYTENVLEAIISVITAHEQLESTYDFYKEVI